MCLECILSPVSAIVKSLNIHVSIKAIPIYKNKHKIKLCYPICTDNCDFVGRKTKQFAAFVDVLAKHRRNENNHSEISSFISFQVLYSFYSRF